MDKIVQKGRRPRDEETLPIIPIYAYFSAIRVFTMQSSTSASWRPITSEAKWKKIDFI